MDIKTIMDERFSLRNYSAKRVDKEAVLKMVDAAIVAPTAANKQPFKLVVVDEPQLVAKIKEAYPRDWFQSVNQLFVVLGNHQTSWKRGDGKDHCDIDVAIVVDHMTLRAQSMGVGTCWVCNFDAVAVSNLLSLPSYLEPIVLLPFGYSATDEVPPKKRLAADNFLTWNGLE